MLDRGELVGWFEFNEIIIEAAAAVAGFYLFLVHSFTSPAPFIPLRIFKDRNFAVGLPSCSSSASSCWRRWR